MLSNYDEEKAAAMSHFSPEDIEACKLDINNMLSDTKVRMTEVLNGNSEENGSIEAIAELLELWGEGFKSKAKNIELARGTKDCYRVLT